MPVSPATSARHWRSGTSTTHKSAAHTKYLPGATTAESKWTNLLDQSREETHRIRRSVEDETGKGDRSELVGIHLRRDRVASVRYSERLNSSKSSFSFQRTDRYGI